MQYSASADHLEFSSALSLLSGMDFAKEKMLRVLEFLGLRLHMRSRENGRVEWMKGLGLKREAAR